MRAIELESYNGTKYTIFIKHIVSFREYGNYTQIHTVDESDLCVKHSYQEVEDMIAACYGAEDEED